MRALGAPFKGFCVGEVGEQAPQLVGFLDVLVHVHAVEGGIQVEGNEAGLGLTEVVGVVHAVVLLVLVAVEVADRPAHLVAHARSLLILRVLVQLLLNVHALDVHLEWRQLVSPVEGVQEGVRLGSDVRCLLLVQERGHRAVHDDFLAEGFHRLLFVLLSEDGVQVLRVDVFRFEQALKVSLVVEDFPWHHALLVINSLIIFSHVFHHPRLGRHLALSGSTFLQEGLELGSVLLDIVVIYVLLAVDVKDWRVV